MIQTRSRNLLIVLAAVLTVAGCGGGAAPAESAQPDRAGSAGAGSSSPPSDRNACALVDHAQLEAIAKETLNMLHNIEEEDKTVCELGLATSNMTVVYVTVHWRGGKELARINQAAVSMAKQMMKNDESADIEALTGSGKARGIADKAYYSDLMPSWFVKGDVLVEVISPTFGHDQTKAVFLSVAQSALPRLP